MSPRKAFQIPSDMRTKGIDELSQPISRTVKIPAEVAINIHSKEISYDADLGVISIRFALLEPKA